MAKEYEIHHRETGSLGEHDEYWTLIVPDRGKPIVRHDCFWGNPYRGEVNHPTPDETPLDQFLAEHDFGVLHEKLTKLLRQLGIDPNA
jgi:hypothetical protein